MLRYQLVNYIAYAVLIWLGRRFKPQSSFPGLLGGGVLGALLFYLITNTASWLVNPFQDPEYTKNLAGWLIALIKGTGGLPPDVGIFPEHAVERRGVHRPVRGGDETDRAGRIALGKGSRRAPAAGIRGREGAGGGKGVKSEAGSRKPEGRNPASALWPLFSVLP